ncbi:MAG: class I SAM-dependent methyltransferase [Sphingomonas sp.]|nr:class I SAM-dependent methyltransferase [Sphingomonas sp.]
MEACNAFYYATRDPLGRDGDFTTAPEISQMFGEIVGADLADVWVRAGRPSDAVYAELGPGRGTLAADALRLMRRAGFSGAVHFVETSPVLRKEQAERVPDGKWHESIDDLPGSPLLLVANEFFDALPIRQFVGEHERRVMVAGGGLAFDRDGEIIERSPAREEAAGAIARAISSNGGVGLFIDYGHERTAPGDTLQAVRGHRYVPTLVDPGDQDLTSHVDFEALGRAAADEGAAVTPTVRQGQWLERLGIGVRAATLASAHPDKGEEVEVALDRLCHEEQMGQLFKVMAIHARNWPVPAGFHE